MFEDIDIFDICFALACLMIPIVYFSKKRLQRKLRRWAQEDKERLEQWKKEMEERDGDKVGQRRQG